MPPTKKSLGASRSISFRGAEPASPGDAARTCCSCSCSNATARLASAMRSSGRRSISWRCSIPAAARAAESASLLRLPTSPPAASPPRPAGECSQSMAILPLGDCARRSRPVLASSTTRSPGRAPTTIPLTRSSTSVSSHPPRELVRTTRHWVVCCASPPHFRPWACPAIPASRDAPASPSQQLNADVVESLCSVKRGKEGEQK